MKKLIFVALAMLVVPFSASATEVKSAYYFYAPWCPHCRQVDEFFKESGFYEKYEISKFNVDKPAVQQILTKVYQVKGYDKFQGIPAVVIDDQLLVGDRPIIDNFEKMMEQSQGRTRDFVEAARISKQETDISLTVLIGAALVDAINPCAFAVLILLVATVIGAKGRRKALISGLLFAFTIFASYFLMGLGLYKVITVFNLPKIISIVVGVVALIIGLANLKDAFWHGKFFLMEVPMSWRPKMKAILQRTTGPAGSVVSAFLVSFFLLPCSSGPYVVILGLLAERVAMAKTVALLALYNLIFILPMVIITVAMYYGVRGGLLEKVRQQNIRLLHGIAGVIMLLIGGYLIYSWL